MSRTTWRALRTELLRGTAPTAAVATLAAAAVVLYVESTDWAGQWMPFAAAVRSGMYTTGAIAVAAGAWQGGRERRRHITAQLDGMPRPAWQQVLVAWAGVTLGCWLGLLIAVAAGAALIAPVATYWGGGWWWLIVVAFIALAALSALGAAFGRLTPYRLAGPVAAVVFYALILFVQDAREDPAEWLAPAARIYESVGSTLPLSLHVQQIAWFGGLAAALLVLAAARRRIFVLIPAAVATAGAVLLTNGSGAAPDVSATSRWEPDPAARELVCTDDELVCLPRAEAFLLDDVAPFARTALARLEGVPGTPTRAVGRTHIGDVVVDETSVYVNTRHITITGGLDTDEARRIVIWHLSGCGSIGERLSNLSTAVIFWVDPLPDDWAGSEVPEVIHALEAMSEADRQAWLTEFVPAAEACDQKTLESLQERLP